MAVQDRRSDRSRSSSSPLPSSKVLNQKAQEVEDLLRQVSLYANSEKGIEDYFERYPKLQSLNQHGQQIVLQMLRSNRRFQGFRIDVSNFILRSHILFLVGTLASDIERLHPFALKGLRVLGVGCGALAEYAEPDHTTDLLTQFYYDRPPITAELLQSLGAYSLGFDPRESDRQVYDYPLNYKHIAQSFSDLPDWLQKLPNKLDVITCFNLFDRGDFAFYYNTPDDFTRFFLSLRAGLTERGLIYTSTPLLQSSEENRQINRSIFKRAGFRVIYEGYYCILRPHRSRSSSSKSS